MASSVEKIRSVCSFLILRKPFFDALILCLVMSERENNKRPALLPKEFVYVYLSVMFLSGTMLSFGNQRSLFALIAAGFTALFSLISHSVMPPIQTWLRVRMIVRDTAVVGSYVIVASRGTERLTRRYNLAWMFQYGCVLLAVFFCITSFQLIRDPQEQGALTLPYHLGGIARIVISGLFMVGGCLLGSDFKTKLISQVLSVAVIFYILLVEMQLSYWTQKVKVEMWTQVDLAVSTMCVLNILLLIALK